MKERRLKPGEWIAMSPEEKLKWKRHLQKRWRHNHPDSVKKQNQYYGNLYRTTKPFLPTCKVCNEKFGAARSCYKICPKCIELAHKRQLARAQEKTDRRNAREKQLKEIIELWKSGKTQIEISKIYGRTQSGISALLRRHNIIKKNTCKQKTKR